MCGITGYAKLDMQNLPPEKVLREMNRLLTHRGPDDEGYFIDDYVALAQRRLSIIDLSGGRQPIFNEDKSIAIVFNGEIYNFPELKKELEKNHRFLTNSDTEVIVHLYEETGEKCLERLNGMFAFCLWDANRNRLFCARDRMGQKPLYYSLSGRSFIFGSELKAILRHPDLSPRLSLEGLNRYLAFEYIPAPGTILEDVYKLQPGHFFTIDFNRPPQNGADIEQISYWDISFHPVKRGFEETKQGLVDVYRDRKSVV